MLRIVKTLDYQNLGLSIGVGKNLGSYAGMPERPNGYG